MLFEIAVRELKNAVSPHIQGALGKETVVPYLQQLGFSYPSNRLVQALCWHAGLGVKEKKTVRQVLTQEKFTACVDLSDHAFRAIFFHGIYEPETTSVLKRLAAPGQIWWDIGANIGWFTLLLSRIVGDEGRVEAFEPNPFTASLLDRAITINGASNVRVRRLALGDRQEEATLYIPSEPGSAEGGHGRPAMLRHADLRSLSEVSVQVNMIDSLVSSNAIPCPFGIKMDAEGFEGAIIAGAQRLFREASPMVVISEINHRKDCLLKPHELVSTIVDFGYRPFHVENLKEYNRAIPIDGSRSKDFLFVHHSADTKLMQRLGNDTRGNSPPFAR
jgi:FkbM family methyltransferase